MYGMFDFVIEISQSIVLLSKLAYSAPSKVHSSYALRKAISFTLKKSENRAKKERKNSEKRAKKYRKREKRRNNAKANKIDYIIQTDPI